MCEPLVQHLLETFNKDKGSEVFSLMELWNLHVDSTCTYCTERNMTLLVKKIHLLLLFIYLFLFVCLLLLCLDVSHVGKVIRTRMSYIGVEMFVP